MKLTSSKDYGKTLRDKSDEEYRELRDVYDLFLEKPLALWMFVPCDENGNILSEPNAEDYFNTNIPIDQYTDKDKDGINKHYFALMSYEDSKERCLFEGFEVHEVFTGVNEKTKTISLRGLINVFWFDTITQTWNPSIGVKNIEGLVNYGLTLTETALKTL